MFTGLIEEIGTMRGVRRSGQALQLIIGARRIMNDVKMGDSIAVNGVCLTVTAYDASSFTADVMPETYRKTNLYTLKPGIPVNLERAMLAGGRYGGHIVQGHVDCTARIISREIEENAVVFRLALDSEKHTKYLLPGGSIAIDGVSLTLVDVAEQTCSVSIIPHTLAETVLQHKQPGDTVNIECDILGKYIERLLRGDREEASPRKGTITESFLVENGFL